VEPRLEGDLGALLGLQFGDVVLYGDPDPSYSSLVRL
jgi:hypothetical protein